MNKKIKGFSILTIVLSIVVIISVISIWALSFEFNSSSTSKYKNDIYAQSLLNDSSNIQLAFNNLIINGADSYSIVFTPNVASTISAPNILDPINGLIINKTNPGAFSNDINKTDNNFISGKWIYNNGVFPNKGSIEQDQYINMIDIKDGVCSSINKNLHGYDGIPQTVFDTEHADWYIGCVRGDYATDKLDENVFYRVLKAH